MNTDRVAEGHCEAEGVGGRCAPYCAECEAETIHLHFTKWNGKLKRDSTIIICTCIARSAV